MRHRRDSYDLTTADGVSVGRRPGEAVFPASDDPGRWRYSRSNGVALHIDWTTACQRASCELAERDRVLRAWYGEIRPERIDFSPPVVGGSEGSYDWYAYSFSEVRGEAEPCDAHVAGVFGFPMRAGFPLAMGFGARMDLREALEAASVESMQRLAFLWGDALPDELPAIGPTPAHHLDCFQHPASHRVLRAWLNGGHLVHGDGPKVTARDPVAFVDLTPPWLGSGFRVAKAVCDSALPLAFGESPFARHLPRELQPHPIA